MKYDLRTSDAVLADHGDLRGELMRRASAADGLRGSSAELLAVCEQVTGRPQSVSSHRTVVGPFTVRQQSAPMMEP